MDIQYFLEFLREKGYKATPQRLEIFKLTILNKDHPSAETIYTEVIKKFPAISIATVYKTLDLLKELGLIQEFEIGEGRSRYETNLTPHLNIICPDCGSVYDYESKSILNFWSAIVKEIGVTPLSQRLDLFVLCNNCNQKSS